jgi:hypothetical protein
MQRLSSNLTLFFKIFIPVSWVSFFGLFGLVIFIIDANNEPFLTSTFFRSVYVGLFILFFALIYFTIFQLKRVESADGFIYTTNYFKTVRFPVENIKKISVMNLGILKIARMHLHNKGIFGNKIPFIAKWPNLNSFRSQYPDIEING